MEQVISKEEFDKLMSLEGEARGSGMKSYADFILKEKGEEGVRKMEETITELGYPVNYKKMKALSSYPIGLEACTLLAIERLFGFDDKKFREMGRFEVKCSLVIRIFMKYFVSIERAAKELSKIWKQHFTVGDFRTVEFNKEKGYLILRLENFHHYHPAQCQVLAGVLLAAVQMILKNDKVTCEETKCPFRGDEYHEFLLKW
jgi:hypothetical protein